MLNRDASDNEVDIYNISSHKGLKGELDTRLLTKDGRNSIKEDLEKTKRAGQSLADVATKDEFKLKDTVQHLDEVLKDLEIQKQFALQNDGKGIETLQGENSTIEQKQEAIKQYAKIYADTYGINIEEANIIATNKFIKGSHYSNDGKKSIIDINDNAQRNAKDYAKTMGHEVTHARISQGTTRDRESDKLNEAYANTMGSYSADGMEFSASTYNGINLDSTLNTNKHIQTASDNKLLNTNNNKFTKRVITDPDNVEFSTAYSDFHNYEKKKEEIESFEQIAKQKEAIGDISVAREYREEVARLKKDVASFEKEYGTGDEALANISNDYNKADAEKLQAIAAIVGSEDVEAMLDGDPMAFAEIAIGAIPIVKGGKYLVKIGDKISEVSKETYDKIKSGVDKLDISISNNNARQLIEKRLVSDGVNLKKAKKIATETVDSFEGQIKIVKGKKGDKFIVTETKKGDASGVYVTKKSAGKTAYERQKNLALPKSNTAKIESKVELTNNQVLLKGKVKSQVGKKKFYEHSVGGGEQIITNRKDVKWIE